MSFILLRGAKRELFAAASRYERAKPNLGNEFLDEVTRSLQRLQSYPQSAPLIEASYRRCLLRRFPYALV